MHGFIDFSWILQAVKCQAISSPRYVTMNPVNRYNIGVMFENITPILYQLTGLNVKYLGLEIAWHFTACRIHDKAIKPCMFKQLETLKLVRRR